LRRRLEARRHEREQRRSRVERSGLEQKRSPVQATGAAPNAEAKAETKGSSASSHTDDPLIEGVCRRAAAWRLKYNPSQTRNLVHPDLLGFHPLNRDGIACNGDRVDELLLNILNDGCDEEEIQRDNFAVRACGPDDDAITLNIEVCAQHPKLATPPRWEPIGFTLAHSHIRQALTNCNQGAKSDVPGITGSDGRIVSAMVQRKDKVFHRIASTGMLFEFYPAAMGTECPEAIHDISAAANIKHGTHLMETTMQGIIRLGRVCAAEASVAGSVCYQAVQKRISATMPKLANSPHFTDVFELALTLGGPSGPFLNALADFFGQWVNPQLRQVRFSTFALLGTLPAVFEYEGRSLELAPLIVAIIKATYACDLEKYRKEEHIEFLSSKDVKLDQTNAEGMQRLVNALAGLRFFHVECKSATAKLSRGERIEFLGCTDLRIANAYLHKGDEKLSIAEVCHVQFKELLDLLGKRLSEDKPAPKDWFKAPKVEDDNEPDDNKSAPAPKLIMYDEGDHSAKTTQDVYETKEEQKRELKAPFPERNVTIEIWKHSVVHALLLALEDMHTRLRLPDKLQILRGKRELIVIAREDLEPTSVVLVPAVFSEASVVKKKKKEVLEKFALIPLKAPEKILTPEDDYTYALTPPTKLPSNKEDPNEDPDKWAIFHGWLAEKSGDASECNMFPDDLPVDFIVSLGGSDALAMGNSTVVIPVFTNRGQIKKGDEIKIFMDHKRKGAPKKKQRTWRDGVKEVTKTEK